MPNRIILEIGTTIAIVPIKATNAQANAAIQRYCIKKGISTNGLTPQQIGEAVLRSLLRYVRDNSVDVQRQQEIATLLASIESTISADNDLFDESA